MSALDWKPLWTTAGGTQVFFKDNGDGTYTVWSTQDNDPILERNAAMANENNGYSPSRDIRRMASIPLNLIQKWKHEEGFDALNPHNQDALTRKMNDIDYSKLRTAHWRV